MAFSPTHTHSNGAAIHLNFWCVAPVIHICENGYRLLWLKNTLWTHGKAYPVCINMIQQQVCLMSYSVIWVSWHFSLAVFTVSSCVSWLCWQELEVHIMQSLIDRVTYSLALDRSTRCFKASLITVASDLEKPLQTFMLIFLSFFTAGIQKSLAAETQNMKCKKTQVWDLEIHILCKWALMIHSGLWKVFKKPLCIDFVDFEPT